MLNNKIQPQTFLSTLWVFILLNMVFRDLHQFAKSGFIEEVMTGFVNGIKITDELMLLGGILAEIPILMVLLSRLLPDKANKWANIIAGIITLAVFATGIPSLDIDDAFHMAIETAAILWIFRIAWKLPTHNNNEPHA
jgi:Sec-independent protein secretion pathway component TatC